MVQQVQLKPRVMSPCAFPFLQALHVDVLRLPRCSRQWLNRRTCIGRFCRTLCGLVARWFDILNEFLPCGKIEFDNG